MHYNNKLSRVIYSRCGELFFMEALRLFKRHGLERLVHNMDKLGIKQSVVYSLEPLTSTQDLINQTKLYPGRFFVFGSVSHAEPDPVNYLQPFMESRAIQGVKIHPMVGGYHASDLYNDTKDYVALARDYGLPVAIHTGDIPIEQLTNQVSCSDISAIEPLVRNFSDCRFILNHLGWESWRAALALAKKYPNVYLETSWQPARIIRRVVDAVGCERVIFGSDFPMFQQGQALEQLQEALTEREFHMVTALNAQNLLRKSLAQHEHASESPRA